ncbi:short-chain fatty acid transporter [Cupriavidus pinatubonensis]|uniref:Short-chain fatty acid transporter n=1 Tax=Cupriavidus pinatubonensis TaxID=248026 RepID=A0ABM8X8Z5_9BURK|nr:short-chain fatty acid transporter [Cupriavidus pinatubonensis]CAG9176441.1 hypothetical protein LMG23994_03413 [Cupriavidus pinatubonensis]
MSRASYLCLAFALLLSACETPPQQATRPAPRPAAEPRIAPRVAIDACEQAVTANVRKGHPEPGSLFILEDREQVYQRPGGMAMVTGEGTFEPDSSQASIGFRFTCLYNGHTARADDVQLRY